MSYAKGSSLLIFTVREEREQIYCTHPKCSALNKAMALQTRITQGISIDGDTVWRGFFVGDGVMVRTIMKGLLDCHPGECHLNNGAECYLDSALCNDFASIVQNNWCKLNNFV